MIESNPNPIFMNEQWHEILSQVAQLQKESKKKGGLLWYRGQRLAEWTVRSSLHRRIEDDMRFVGQSWDEKSKIEMMRDVSKTLFYKFKSRAWNLLDMQEKSDWGIVFSMQHHGIPTRLLDWTESFACAVYFAQDGRKPDEDAAIFILDPEALNKNTFGVEGLVALSGDEGVGNISTHNYHPGYISTVKLLPTIAAAPVHSNPRMRAQSCAFTLCGDSFESFENLYPDFVKKIILPASVYEDAEIFLDLVGLKHFGYYPDFEGLKRELVDHMDREIRTAKEIFQDEGN
ncbi:MAG: FRG domain-containing protein [Blastocatellia bacterium]|nr:FRG domain-containing protein [Blastocatellia bacterium]